MRPLTHRLLQQLDLKTAASEEASSTRNLLPPEPEWWTLVPDYASILQKITESRLGSGMAVHRMAEVAARKSRHGVRPLPIVGIAERVAYRALTNFVSAGAVQLNRSADDWRDFSVAPAKYGEQLAPTKTSTPGIGIFANLLPWSSPIRYVLKSDVVAFYRHVDHALLHEQLILLGADYEAAQCLIDLLGEIQGRPVGLPQQHGSSDILSEIYIDAVEREMLRRGHRIWRFNDDFRVACHGYMEALRALEDLDSCLRGFGLTVNEAKTAIPTFSSYYLEVLGLAVSDSGKLSPREDVEDLVGDYTDDFTEDADAAAVLMTRVVDVPSTDDNSIDLREAGPGEVRLIRRALNGLARARDDRALAKIPMLVRYLAELTPTAVAYVVRLADARVARTKIANALDEIAERTATNDWQKMWVAHAYDRSGVLALKRNRSSRIEWLQDCTQPRFDSPLRAYAAWVLCKSHDLDVEDLMAAQAGAPAALHLYYAAGIRLLARSTAKAQLEKAFADDALLRKLAKS